MPKPSDAQESPEVQPAETTELLPFSYPSIGNGITIMARNQAEADEKAKRHPLNHSSSPIGDVA
jgi:hypothetical protein